MLGMHCGERGRDPAHLGKKEALGWAAHLIAPDWVSHRLYVIF